MKKKLLFMPLLCLLSSVWGQNPNNNAMYGCRVLSLAKPKQNNMETAFCSDCSYWPNGIVPFEFESDLDLQKRNDMLDAMSRLEGIANINFVPRNGEDDYLHIKESDAPYNYSSDIGRAGGGQDIGIINWGYPMIICHELMHALGFWHEQSRPDRNNYVQINYENICPGAESQFDISETTVTPNIPYDFRSIMHYGYDYFSKCINANEDCEAYCPGGVIGSTIVIRPPYQNGQNFIGNRAYISSIDSLMLKFTYPFPNDRFVNVDFNPQQPTVGLAIYSALTNWTSSPLLMNILPVGANVWIMPGTYNNSEGTYSKPMILRAPFGGVVLK